jgi:hypothetical protein
MRNQHIEHEEKSMAQNTNPKGQQDQRMGNQGANQGALNPERRGYGGVTNDDDMPVIDKPSNPKGQATPVQRQPGQDQQGGFGAQNVTDRTKPSAQGPQQGFGQQRGNIDPQRNESIGQRGQGETGAGQQNEPIEMPKMRPETERR